MVGLLIVTHNDIGLSLVDTATAMLGICPLATEVLPVLPDSDPDTLLDRISGLVSSLDQGEGVLVMTDVYGSTPSNVANSVAARDEIIVVAGVNLPMLIRVLNYPSLSLVELAEKALSGGRDGIFVCEPSTGE